MSVHYLFTQCVADFDCGECVLARCYFNKNYALQNPIRMPRVTAITTREGIRVICEAFLPPEMDLIQETIVEVGK